MDPIIEKNIKNAFQLLKEGNKQEAFAILAPIVKANPNIAEAWYLLGFTLPDPQKRLYAFQQVLRIDPTNHAAQKQIAKLLAAQSASPASQSQPAVTPRPATAPAAPVAKKRPAKKQKISPFMLAGIGAAVLCLCFVVIGVAWGIANGSLLTGASAAPVAGGVPTVAPTGTSVPVTPTVAPSPTPAFIPVFRGTGCDFDVPLGTRVRCGVVKVPMDRTKNYTDLIEIPVVIYQSSKPNADVLVYLQGGPGSESLDWSLALFDDWVKPFLEEYDMVFFDPRGTGRSEPRLDCPELNDAFIDSYFQIRSEDDAYKVFIDAWGKCHERFKADGIDPGAFNTTQSAADVRDIAVALGYEKVNLIGISYGTRLALTIMRDHPEIVRSAIIDSVVPLETKMLNRRAADIQYALDKMFTDCAASVRCNKAYPDLRNVFNKLIERFDKEPVPVKIQDPYSGFVFNVLVDGVDMLSAVVAGMHTSELVPVIPKAIYDIEKGDYTFLSFALGVSGGSYHTMSLGTYFSAMCHEQVYATDPQQMEAELTAPAVIKKFSLASIFGKTERVFQLCDSWGALPHTSEDSTPVTANIPTLVISGEYDPTTPVTTGETVDRDLPDDYFYVIPGMGHGATVGNGCADDIVMSFLKDPTKEPEHTCLEKETAFDFFLPYDGSEPINFVPITEPSVRVKGVIPEGWKKHLPYNAYQRKAYLFDPTMVEFASFGAPKDFMVRYLTMSFEFSGFEETPHKVGSYKANGLDWTIYDSRYNGEPVLLALAEVNSRWTIALIVVVSAPERDAFYEHLLIPMLDALVPVG
jgi:pimeloyl-ACP methyl ester carboxylesterase